MDFGGLIARMGDIAWGWPLIIFFVVVGILTTISLYFVQFRYFLTSWKLLFAKQEKTEGEMSPFQAFINALGISTGNGSIAGIAVAISVGGPGSAFWLLIAGIFCLALRFAEIYLATSITEPVHINHAPKLGGPMIYLKRIPGGKFLTPIYTVLIFVYGILGGSMMQANSVGHSIWTTWGIDKTIIAFVLLAFVVYVVLGGAQRIIKISDKLVPFKVGIFLISFLIVIFYHFTSIPAALKLMFMSAFNLQAVGGAMIGFAIQAAIREGFAKLLNATEAGLGSAAVFFGASASRNPMKDSVMSMLSTFISAYIVCFGVALAIVASGVWNLPGKEGIALTISSFETVFGYYGGWIVTFCSVSFGLGVLVPYMFIARETWLFLTKGRFVIVFSVLYCLITFFGALAKVKLVWDMMQLIVVFLMLINMYAIVYYLPYIRSSIKKYVKKEENFLK